MSNRVLWVVEVKMLSGSWEPTDGAYFSREGGREGLKEWRLNSVSPYRLAKYRAVKVD